MDTKETRPVCDSPIATINVTPMVDIMPVLLIIFMVVTPLLTTPGPPMDLSRARNPREMREADRENALVVALTRDGRIFPGPDEMDRDRLAGTLKNRLADQLMKTV
jgi:biopolymer transport protein ExbD/biopolymer transport protein TolR